MIKVQVFTHVDPVTQKVTHFDASAMYSYATCHFVANLPGTPPGIDLIKVAMEQDHIDLVLTKRGIEFGHVMRLLGESKVDPRKAFELATPMIAVHMDDDTTLTVDGHHRFAVWAFLKMTHYRILRFRKGTWKGFVLELPEEQSRRFVDDTLRSSQ